MDAQMVRANTAMLYAVKQMKSYAIQSKKVVQSILPKGPPKPIKTESGGLDNSKMEEGNAPAPAGAAEAGHMPPAVDKVGAKQPEPEATPSEKAPSVKAPSLRGASVRAEEEEEEESEEEEEDEAEPATASRRCRCFPCFRRTEVVDTSAEAQKPASFLKPVVAKPVLWEETTDDEEEPETQGWFWVAAAIAVYLLACASGSQMFVDKWWHVPGPGWDFQKHGPHIDQDANTCHSTKDGAPCYYGMINDRQQFFLWFCLPFAPWFVALPLVCSAVCRMESSWPGPLVGFCMYTRAKVMVEIATFTSFDPSDVVTVGMVGLAIAFKEVAVAGLHLSILSLVTLLTSLGVLASFLYYSYFSCVFLHTPAEVKSGAMYGLLLVIAMKWLVTPGSEGEYDEDEDDAETGYVALSGAPVPA
ncbi:unnamed protein product [Polarella glacialis]|uniref:Uncharacterized protein n=1 Tax=Polarella glacialis TaxID=89957 RepID=A0A813IH40_POLGL|nr:unnamed protein product [Polarella glacialis]